MTVEDERCATLDTDDLDRLRTYMKWFEGVSYEDKCRAWSATQVRRAVQGASGVRDLKPYYFDPNRSYFEQLARVEL